MKTRFCIYLTIIVLSLAPGVRGEPHRPTLPATDAFQGSLAKNAAAYLSESPRRGPDKAPVSIVVFSDFQCPACAGLEPVLEQVLETYPESVTLVYKNYPLRSHRFALAAAAAAMAAQNQGEFWAFHDLLFLNYRDLDLQKLMEIARDLSLDEQQLLKDMNSRDVLAAIERDIREGNRIGISGTPTVLVNGKALTNRSFAGFQTVIDAALDRTDGAFSLNDASGRHHGPTIANKENTP